MSAHHNPSAMEWIDQIGLVDHHCHGVLNYSVDRKGFEDLITESDEPAPVGTTFFDTQLGFAVRRHCAPQLGLESFAAPELYMARRRELGIEQVNRTLMTAQRYESVLIETGHKGDVILSPSEMGAIGNCGYAEVVRLERIAEEIVEAGIPVEQFRETFSETLNEQLATAVGTKSIAAYRIGLDFNPARPTTRETDHALASWYRSVAGGAPVRLEDPTVIRHLIWTSVDRGVPLQFHIGYGDPDVNLHRCNPLLLTEFLRRSRGSGSSIMLLHCYPFHREAGYLAHCFEHVYCDVGLAVNYTGSQSVQVIRESLELTPFHKSLFSSDAWGAPELFHLGALLFRRGLAKTLDDWASQDGLPQQEQQRVASMIARDNAYRVYGLDQVKTIRAATSESNHGGQS